jgi:hypothetical protein
MDILFFGGDAGKRSTAPSSLRQAFFAMDEASDKEFP